MNKFENIIKELFIKSNKNISELSKLTDIFLIPNIDDKNNLSEISTPYKIRKQMLDEIPSVLNFVDSVKRALPKKDKVCFAVLLQLIESYVCIDNTLTAIHKHNIKVLTRHDSFCVPNDSKEKAYPIIYNELTRLLPYGFNLKTSWNYEQ